MKRDPHHGNDYPLGTLATDGRCRFVEAWNDDCLGFAWLRFSLFVPMDGHKLLMKI
jgi:hypothetical protein